MTASLFVAPLTESQRDSKGRPQLWASISLLQTPLSAAFSLASSLALRFDSSPLTRSEELEDSCQGSGMCPSHKNSAAPDNKRMAMTKLLLRKVLTRQRAFGARFLRP